MIKQALKGVSLFKEMTDEELDVLTVLVEEKRLAVGETLFKAGDSDRNLYLIQIGMLEICKEGPTGRPQVLATLQDGDLCGEMSFLDEREHSVSAIALTDAVVYVLSHERFEKLIEAHPRLVYKLLKGIVIKIHGIVREMNTKHVDMAEYMFMRSY